MIMMISFGLSRCLRTVVKPAKRSREMLLKLRTVNICAAGFSDEPKGTPEKPYMPEPSPGRGIKILKDDLKRLMKGKVRKDDNDIFPHYCDVVIIGGGIMGCSIAYWLKQKAGDGLRCVVIERDPTYTRCSTTLSVGGMRQQFSLPENIQMSLYSAEFLRNIRTHLSVLDMESPEVYFQPHGYLCLAGENGAEQLEINYKLQKELGGKVELLSPEKIREQFPWIDTNGVSAGCHGLQNEGWFDPWCLLNAFKRKAVSLGTQFLNAEVTGFEFRSSDEVYLEDKGQQFPSESLDRVVVKTDTGEFKAIQFSCVIVAAGAYSGDIGKMAKLGSGPSVLKHAIPVEPRKRYVYVIHCAKGPGIECPLVIDPSGAYFRREGLGGNYLSGKSPSPAEEPDVTNLDVDYSYFEKQVWPLISNRVPCFEAIKLKTAWAGFYDYNSFDQNAIIGFHPYYTNMFLATGFSGHGIQQAPAVGRAISELFLEGNFQTIDLSRFGFGRIIDNEPLFEKNIF